MYILRADSHSQVFLNLFILSLTRKLCFISHEESMAVFMDAVIGILSAAFMKLFMLEKSHSESVVRNAAHIKTCSHNSK